MRRLGILVVIAGFILLSACAGPSTPTLTPTPDPASAEGKGLTLFQSYCASCHALQEKVIVVGPPLAHIAGNAASRVDGLTAQDYIRDSIVRPNDYVVEGYASGTMRQDFASVLTSDEVDEIIAFLMTQK